MQKQNPVAIQRLDYSPFQWRISRTRLHFILEPDATTVRSELTVHHQTGEQPIDATSALQLDGVELELQRIAVDGKTVESDQYVIDERSLTLFNLPASCVISIDTIINPDSNSALEGLYRSGGNFCTQCEAEGFRKITYYPDRPDVLSVFDVTIEANQNEYPVLLSNGNLLEQRKLANGRHQVSWHDPHPKPCYLFALVAGKLAVLEDSFVTRSGTNVLLQIFVQEHNRHLCDYAMQALKRSMRWDEEVYGFEYDLQRFMIVAVDDFNMGAMENKGLNIFNSKYVLADVSTATDADFRGVEAVIAHEYFHNWTGNRITCRDWFQLSLKEGLTVFRDQCFSSDMHSATVKRIADVRLLRARQFAEDASPMAHPVRPESYLEINNFYTLTVYEKGAEIIRMLHTLLGASAFRHGIDEYVRRHDGSATTCEAFIDAMQSVTDLDLSQFRQWYEIAGTPVLTVNDQYDAAAQRYSLHIQQQTPDTSGQCDKPAMFIPLVVGLLDESGQALNLLSKDTPGRPVDDSAHSVILDIEEHSQTFVFGNVKSRPVASLLRGFSAPVRVDYPLEDEQLALLIAHDTDAFNRWEAVQRLAERVIVAELDGTPAPDALQALNNALSKLLTDTSVEDAFKAEVLQLPSLLTLAESLEQVDYQQLGAARDRVQESVAMHLESTLCDFIGKIRNPSISLLSDEAMGMRSVANAALLLLTHLDQSRWLSLAHDRFSNADNMTDRLAALSCLCHLDTVEREQALDEFYHLARQHKLVLDKWFTVQACSRRHTVMDDVLELYEHVDFDMRNPNRARSLIAGFAMNNPLAFHHCDGRGYQFLTQCVLELDAINPQVAAALVTPLTRWTRVIEPQQQLMVKQLRIILDCKTLSGDVYELVSKSVH